MSALSNPRWEMFAIGLVSGKSQVRAYKDAGFQMGGASGNATTLAKRPEIQARVAELIEQKTAFKSQFVKTNDLDHEVAISRAYDEETVSKGWVIRELMDNVKAAREASQFTASNQALKMLGDEIGMFKTKNTDDGNSEKPKDSPSPVSIDAINKLLEANGYTGPTIDLTKSTAVKIESK